MGAGVMGRGIAGLAASRGIPVLLLDLPGEEDRNALARRGLERALQGRRPAIEDRAAAARVEPGNTEDDFARLEECDWVVEAIPERPESKRRLLARLEEATSQDTVVTTNTSGIPVAALAVGRGDGFRRRFFGTHFFNPPHLMRLLEVIPGPETDPAVVERMVGFAESVLDKGVVPCRDSPGFVANRIGVYATVRALRLMEEHGLTIGETDVLTGPLLGRPVSATFRTADIAGLDVLVDTAAGLASATGEELALPGWVHALVEAGRLGAKTGEGFYRKVGQVIEALDYRTGEYSPRRTLGDAELLATMDAPLSERLETTLSATGRYGAFARAWYTSVFRYTLVHAAELAFDLPSVDRAMEWGYGWEAGPFRQMDLLGPARLRELLHGQEMEEPDLLRRAGDTGFHRGGGGENALPIVPTEPSPP